MQEKCIYVLGLDVDDKRYHGFAIAVSTGEVQEFRSEPNVTALKRHLSRLNAAPKDIRICYEATYLGFSLCREMRKSLYQCDVIAPSLIPKCPGNKVKTDRLDAEKLARYYLAGILTVVNVPDPVQEANRDLLRSRKFLTDQMSALKKHINSITRRLGWNYKTENAQKSTWTKDYMRWLKSKVTETDYHALKSNVEILLRQYQGLTEALESFDIQVVKLSETPHYKPSVKALSCYRGIDRLTALVLVTELGDIKRFSHPRQLTSYAGLDIVESSSGGNERKFHISKDGNRFVRTAVIEACQRSDRPIAISRKLKLRREGIEPQYIDIADRCMRRLNQKSRRLLAKGKNRNKVKVACAREMLCFVWETMQAVV